MEEITIKLDEGMVEKLIEEYARKQIINDGRYEVTNVLVSIGHIAFKKREV